MTKEETRIYMREWARKNRAKIRAKHSTPEYKAKRREYRAKNRELFNAREAAWRKAHGKRTAEMYRKYRLKTEYGLTETRYRRLAAVQGGLCVICDDMPSDKGQKLYIDHNHKTGKFRGLLCQRCNTGLGYFRDNINFLRRASVYIKRCEQSPNGSWRG